MKLKHVLVTLQLNPENRQILAEALAPAEIHWCHPGDRAAIAECIHLVEIAILQADADDQILSGEKLRWIHCGHAGPEKTARPELFRRGIVLTCGAGRSASALAEHAFYFLLALTYGAGKLAREQSRHHWSPEQMAGKTGLYGKTLGIVGLGNTGTEAARLAKQFHMKVVAWRRRMEGSVWVDRCDSADRGEGVERLLHESDYVLLCAGLNDQTKHLIDRRALHLMKPTAYLVNLGRGGLVDESALAEALTDGVIAGAGLDTFAAEPLPEDSPLWDMPNVLITPHATPAMPDGQSRILQYVLPNIQAYREGTGFINQLTEEDVYSQASPKG